MKHALWELIALNECLLMLSALFNGWTHINAESEYCWMNNVHWTVYLRKIFAQGLENGNSVLLQSWLASYTLGNKNTMTIVIEKQNKFTKKML